MPSGAKKRKAAKKKREKETNTNTSTNNPQGNNELKSQDEKGSDGGESGSSAYHDHDDDHHNPFNEGNDEVVEERDPPAAQPYAADAKSGEEVPSDIKIDEAVGGKEDCLIMIERDLKSGESCESKNVSVAHIEPAKESDSGNENSGSLNDETVTEENSKDEPYNSVKETVTFDELVKSIDSSHAKMTLITENASVGETGNSVVESPVDPVKAVASISEVKGNDTGNTLQEKSVASQVAATDLAMKINEDKVYTLSDENARTSSLEEPKPKEFDNKVSASVSQSPFPESTNGAEHVKDSDTPECCENQPLVTSAPSVVQKTSWLSCCGLFEVLTGSNG